MISRHAPAPSPAIQPETCAIQKEALEPAAENSPAGRQNDDKASWDAVDEAGWESFPASDPPSFGPAGDEPSPS